MPRRVKETRNFNTCSSGVRRRTVQCNPGLPPRRYIAWTFLRMKGSLSPSVTRGMLLPSNATSSPPDSSAVDCIQSRKQASKASGGIQSSKNVAESVVAGNAVGQFEEGGQPSLLGSSVGAEERNGEDVEELVSSEGKASAMFCRRGSRIASKARGIRDRLGVHAKAPLDHFQMLKPAKLRDQRNRLFQGRL